jgi:hypothetical protein
VHGFEFIGEAQRGARSALSDFFILIIFGGVNRHAGDDQIHGTTGVDRAGPAGTNLGAVRSYGGRASAQAVFHRSPSRHHRYWSTRTFFETSYVSRCSSE